MLWLLTPLQCKALCLSGQLPPACCSSSANRKSSLCACAWLEHALASGTDSAARHSANLVWPAGRAVGRVQIGGNESKELAAAKQLSLAAWSPSSASASVPAAETVAIVVHSRCKRECAALQLPSELLSSAGPSLDRCRTCCSSWREPSRLLSSKQQAAGGHVAGGRHQTTLRLQGVHMPSPDTACKVACCCFPIELNQAHRVQCRCSSC